MGWRNAITICVFMAGLTLNPALAVEPGQVAPEFVLPGGQSGEVVRLSDHQDKVVYLYFWTSWCGTCVQAFPWLNEMQSKYGAKGLKIIAINLDVNAKNARDFLAENTVNFLIAMDTRASTPSAYKVKALHTSLLAGPGGKVISRKIVVNDADQKMVESSIRQALESGKST